MNYRCPLEELRFLLTRIRFIKKKYKITNADVRKIERNLNKFEREFKIMQKHNMNQDIKDFDIFALTRRGTLTKLNFIKSTNDYNHYVYNLHHFIEKQHYVKNKKWYDERGIKQFLILLPIPIHEQLHGIAIKNLTDEEFKARYKISRWALLFNKKYSEY